MHSGSDACPATDHTVNANREGPPRDQAMRALPGGSALDRIRFPLLETRDTRPSIGQPLLGSRQRRRAGLAGAAPDPEELVYSLAEVGENVRVGRRCECPLEPIRRHIASELVIVPEQPAQNFELLFRALAAKAAVPLGEM